MFIRKHDDKLKNQKSKVIHGSQICDSKTSFEIIKKKDLQKKIFAWMVNNMKQILLRKIN